MMRVMMKKKKMMMMIRGAVRVQRVGGQLPPPPKCPKNLKNIDCSTRIL